MIRSVIRIRHLGSSRKHEVIEGDMGLSAVGWASPVAQRNYGRMGPYASSPALTPPDIGDEVQQLSSIFSIRHDGACWLPLACLYISFQLRYKFNSYEFYFGYKFCEMILFVITNVGKINRSFSSLFLCIYISGGIK